LARQSGIKDRSQAIHLIAARWFIPRSAQHVECRAADFQARRAIIRITRTVLFLAAVVPVFSASLAAQAQTQPVAAAMAPSALPASLQFDLTSQITGRSYRVRLAQPFAPPPPGGHPVLYVLDGDGYFHGFAEAARLRHLGGELEAAVVVGIGYPEAGNVAVVMRRRKLDLTPTPGPIGPDGADKAEAGNAREVGDAERFLRVVQEEIKPRIAALAKVDPKRSILWGHSLGGLFVLHTLFNHPDAFQTYLAQSPSIWWDGRAVLRGEPAFSAAVASRNIAPRVFIGVGGKEQDLPVIPASASTDTATKARQAVMDAAMIDNVQALAARLAALQGGPGYRVESHVFADQSHMSVPYAALNVVLDFALLARSAK